MNGIIVLCRENSKRLPKKALIKIFDKPTILHLLDRLNRSSYKIVVAIPENEKDSELDRLLQETNYDIFYGDSHNPLKRMVDCADKYGFNNVIRVTHDDLFIDIHIMNRMVRFFEKSDLDYSYTSLLPEGCGSEVIKLSAMKKALKTGNVFEGVSHYFRTKDFKWEEYRTNYEYQYQHRVTLDTKEDLIVIKTMCEQLPRPVSSIKALDIVHYLNCNSALREVNRQPKVSIYIPNYNLGKFVGEAIESALNQTYQDIEVIVIDDCSTDDSFKVYKKYIDRVRFIFNDPNLGLPESANRAIEASHGKFIVRIDADDKLLPNAIEDLLNYAENHKEVGAIYPAYLLADESLIVTKECKPPFDPNENEHHPTGCLIRKRMWEDLKYTEGLTDFESYFFYKRFSKSYPIGYLSEPLWIKRNRPDSMMNSNLERRKERKREIDGK